MNNDLEQFSEDFLNEMIVGGLSAEPSNREVSALARIALAAKQAKPVAWEVKGILCHTKEEANIFIGEPEPLYDTPQPAHTEQVIPSEIPKVPHNGGMAYKKGGSIYSTNYARGWNDCVQTMLTADPKPESE